MHGHSPAVVSKDHSPAVVPGFLTVVASRRGSRAQKLGSTGLVAPWHVGSSWTRDKTHVPCIGGRILNHCHKGSAISLVSTFLCYYIVFIM